MISFVTEYKLLSGFLVFLMLVAVYDIFVRRV